MNEREALLERNRERVNKLIDDLVGARSSNSSKKISFDRDRKIGKAITALKRFRRENN